MGGGRIEAGGARPAAIRLARRLKRPLRRDDYTPCSLNYEQGLLAAPAKQLW